MSNNHSVDDLAVFLTVVRVGGFRAAARKLGVAASKVSTTVSRLEAALGVPLLVRTTRSVRTTDAGQALAERIGPHLAGLDAACDEAAQTSGHVRGRLRINVPGAVMPDILPRLLATFHARHPEVETEVVVENTLVDIVAAGCDAGVRYGELVARDMVSVPIGPRKQRLALGASPDYAKAHGLPARPEELPGHAAIRYRLPDGPLLPWRLTRGRRVVSVEPRSRLVLAVDAIDTGLAYAEAGIGILGAFHNWMEASFAAGTLVPVLPGWWPEMDGPRLYYPSRRASPPLRAFIDVCRSAA